MAFHVKGIISGLMTGAYERVASLIPKPVMEKFKKELNYVGFEIRETKFVGFLLIYGFFISFFISLNLFFFFNFPMVPSFVLIFVFFVGGIYLWMTMSSESKGRFVEKILPDALQLIASNIKSGITTEQALFLSARPEFGIFSRELKIASKKIVSGTPVEDALSGLPERIHSKTLERTMWLITQSIRSGGEIAEILLQLAEDLRNQMALKDEVNANVSLYILLIFIAAGFGAPFLLGVSSFIVEIISQQNMVLSALPEVSMQGSVGSNLVGFMGGAENVIPPEVIFIYTLLFLAVGAVFGAFTVGVIEFGSEKDGIKYIPIIVIISFFLFYAVRAFLLFMFGDLIV